MKNELNKILFLIKEKKLSEAKDTCLNILKSNKENEEIYNIYAIVLFQLNEHKQAIINWKKSIEINPNYSHAYNNLGKVFFKLKKFNEALLNFNEVTKINPKYFEAHHYKAQIFSIFQKYDDAVQSWNIVINLKPDFAEGYIKRGDIFFDLKKFDRALSDYTSASILDPQHPFVFGFIVLTRSIMCDWKDLNKDLDELKKNLSKFKKISPPFTSLLLLDSPSLQKISAEIWAKEYVLRTPKIESISRKTKKKKIRIGYYSGDFNNHAVGYLISHMLELHDKSNFEIFGFYFGKKVSDKDEAHNRIVNSLDKYIDISLMSNLEVVQLSRNLEVDIAIDLTAHTGNINRFGIFINRCAPIQVNFLGYPGTSGSNTIDYLIADKILIPEKNQQFYSEKIVYLPHTYQPNELLKKIPEKFFDRHELGLPEKGFIFCCFNAHQKITPAVFKIWMKLLKNNNDSVLWLLEDNEISSKNLKLQASLEDINPNKIIFAKRLSREEHLARHKVADLFLDTFPYTAHTTGSDSLQSGVPILTCLGETFASRVSASLLNAIGLEELIVSNHKDYEETAIKIMNNPAYLVEIKLKLKKNKLEKPLFNSKLFTKNLEKAYSKIYEKYINNEKVDHIVVKSQSII